jgi:hypothetical protein
MLHCCVLQVTVRYTAWQCITIMLHCCVLQVTVTYTAWQCIQIYFVLKDKAQIYFLPVILDPINKIGTLQTYTDQFQTI